MINNLLEICKVLVLVSILFVWVIRYDNIIQEFKAYGYPAWLRDIVGIFKISFAVMVMSQNIQLVQIGSLGIAILMIAALGTHIRVKNQISKMLPSFGLMCTCLFIFAQYSL